MKREDKISEIWLEVSNIALNDSHDAGGVSIEIQLKGDNEDDRWLIYHCEVEKFKPLMEAMKDKRPIHARLSPVNLKEAATDKKVVAEDKKAAAGGKKVASQEEKKGLALKVTALRISFSATPARG